EAIEHRSAGRLELRTFGVPRQHVERRPADELRDLRPRLAGGADRLAERELIERRPLDQVGETEETLRRQRPVDDHTAEITDESPPRVEPSVADREREELRQQTSDLVTVSGVEIFAAAVRKNRDRVRRDELRLFDNRRRDLLSQILLQLAGTFRIERGIAA